MKLKNNKTPLDLRPKCKIIDIDLSKKEVLNKIQSNLVQGNDIAVGFLDTEDNHIELKIPTSQRHYWSPKMNIWVDEDKNGTSLSCVVGPNTNIWNVFMIFYIIALSITTIGIVIGFYQKFNHETPYFFWAAPIGLLFLLGINFAARIGQYWGETQVKQLKGFISMCIDKKI